MPKDKKSITIVAHRGGCRGFLPENSLAAFQCAVKNKVSSIEMDIRLNHWNKTFYLAHDLIHRPRAHRNFFYKVVEIIPPKTTLYCELKTYTLVNSYYAKAFWETIKEYNLEKQIVVMSYNPFVLSQLRRIGYKGKIGLLIGSRWLFNFIRLFLFNKIRPDIMMFSRYMICARRVKYARRHQSQVYLYVANRERDWYRGLAYGVDGFITDYPLQLRGYLQSKGIKNN